MKLYDCPGFPNPRRVRIFLAEKGVSVDSEIIDLYQGEHRNTVFKAKNPLAELPTLELDDGTCLSEAIAISRYLEERYPEPPLMGSTPKEKALIEMWQRRVERLLLEPTTAYFHHVSPGLGSFELYRNREWGEKNREKALTALTIIDGWLYSRQFLAGDKFSIADIIGLCALDFATALQIDIPSDAVHLQRWYAQINSRSSACA